MPNLTNNEDFVHFANQIIASHPDCIFYCDKDTKVRTMNIAAQEFTNKTINDCIGISIEEIVGKGIISDIYKIKEVFTKGNSTEYISNVSNLDVTEAYKVNAWKFQDGIFVKIKKEKQVSLEEDELTEKNFKMLFENMSSGFVYLKAITDYSGNVVDFVIVDLNPSFELMINLEREDVVGKFLTKILQDLPNSIIKKIGNSATRGVNFSSSLYFKTLDKHLALKSYSPRKGYAAITLSDQKAEMQIRQDLKMKGEVSKAFATDSAFEVYNAILDLLIANTQSESGFMGYVQDNKLVCHAIKCPFVQTDGVDQEGTPTISLSKTNVLTPCFREKTQIVDTYEYNGQAISYMLTPIIYKGEVLGIVSLSQSKNGEYMPKEIEFAQGLCNYIAPMMFTEVNARNYRNQIIHAKQIAEQNEALKTTFLANMSHEVRTPMNSIMGFARLLSKGDNLTQKQKNYLDFIVQSSEQLLNVVENIMDMSKLQTGQTKLNLSKTSINTILQEVYNQNLQLSKQKNINLLIVKDLESPLDEIYIDNYKIKKVFNCLINNALKYTNDGFVSFGYEKKNNYLEFFVKDTGIGIREELHKDIFNSFCQSESLMKRQYNGVGIGLSISKGFVNLMGGDISLTSKPNIGSTFYFTLEYKTNG